MLQRRSAEIPLRSPLVVQKPHKKAKIGSRNARDLWMKVRGQETLSARPNTGFLGISASKGNSTFVIVRV